MEEHMTRLAWHVTFVLPLLAACGSPAVDLGNAGADLSQGADAHVADVADASLPDTAPLLTSAQPASLLATSCTDDSDLAAQAQQQCDALGLPRTASVFFGGLCGLYRSTSLTFLCAEELPPNMMCSTQYLGSDNACVEDSVLLAKARALSADGAVTFADILFDHACGPAQSHWAQFEYCGPIGMNPLRELGGCTNSGVDSAACIDPEAMVWMGRKQCAAQGLALTLYAFGGACTSENDSVRAMKYQCCPNSF
jgi:hypothetical protein